ncbi:hypothetical protein L596_019204 [Steinernema carpocapsae]|uniref:Serpentine receptor class gamma n=1 Tax=Steinernema carpocapsae TaxID=34508 RepID=A0A4U5MPV2_STECR|nr:hypothetical protein L596_019204 [Steinernema carpocapsae]
MAMFFTSKCGIIYTPQTLLLAYDYSKPLTYAVNRIALLISLFSFFISLLSYLVIFIYLGTRREKPTGASKDRSVLVFGVLKFIFDSIAISLFAIQPLPRETWTEVVTTVLYTFDFYYISLVLYLILNRTLRNEFFGAAKLKQIFKSSQPDPTAI